MFGVQYRGLLTLFGRRQSCRSRGAKMTRSSTCHVNKMLTAAPVLLVLLALSSAAAQPEGPAASNDAAAATALFAAQSYAEASASYINQQACPEAQSAADASFNAAALAAVIASASPSTGECLQNQHATRLAPAALRML